MIPVAEATKERSFFRCEHGTFHLLWGNAVFSLTLEQLSDLQTLLMDVRQIGGYTPLVRGPLRLQQRVSPDSLSFFELWMADVGIRLASRDCRVLEKLIVDTLTWVEKQPPFTPEGHTLTAQRLANMDALPLTFESLSWN
jgi:hypothetical protein